MNSVAWRDGMGIEVQKRIELMRLYSERGKTLLGILPLIGIKKATAMKYARLNDIQFSDHKRRKQKEVISDAE